MTRTAGRALRFSALTVAVAAGGVALGSVTSGAAPDEVGEKVIIFGEGVKAPTDIEPVDAYPVNAQGLTFGSVANAPSPDKEPDLILVINTNGQEAYVYGSDLNPPPNATEAELAAWSAARSGSTVIPAYQSDGLTRLGSFVINDKPPANEDSLRPDGQG